MDVTVASPAGSGIHTRIYGPKNFEDEFLMAKNQDEIMPVLAKIEVIYDQVHLGNDKLVDNGGFCFGLLSPATNILVNSVIISKAAAAGPPARGGGGGRHHGGRDMSQRSLDGLIAFLTCLFPYLPDAEAVAYLDAAEADPLVAALLVIDRRGLRRFGFCSGTTVAAVEAALACAAAAAKHPDPRRFVLGWKLLSRGLSCNLAAGMESGSAALRVLHATREMSDTDLHMKELWVLAEARRLDGDQTVGSKELPPARAAVKRQLLATIHGFYLQALARLPTAELRSRYHRSMLDSGSCYGPLDPVSNIIVNTVWYDQACLFPAGKQVTLDMISTAALWRAAARSLYGLVSFLCTRYPGLSPDLALRRLQAAEANLQVADPNLFDNCAETKRSAEPMSTPSTSAAEAYAAAAAAAFHPSHDAQKELLGAPDSVRKLQAASQLLHLQDGRRMLSSEDLELLSMLLLNCSASSIGDSHLQQQVPAAFLKVNGRLSRFNRNRFWCQHERIKSMVEAVLDEFNKTNVPKYRLHVICAVNEKVFGPEISLDREVRGYYTCTPKKYHNSHINFLATREECASNAPATLFFAECRNHGTGTACWCAPVSLPHPDAEQVRCIYCEHKGIRVVHPDDRNFHGRDEFETFYGSNGKSGDRNNDDVIMKNGVHVDWVHDVQDDAIYCTDDDDGDEDDFTELHIS